MNLHYKIIEVWPDNHQIVVRYTTDIVNEEMVVSFRDEEGKIVRCRTDVAITLPIPSPEGDQLEKLIIENAPIAFLNTLENVIDPNVDTSLSNLGNLKGKTFTKEVSVAADPIGPSALTDDEIQEMIKKFSADNDK